MSLRKMFEMLNRINHTPSFSKLDAKVLHKEKINCVLTKENGKKKKI
jgi:hypothetical protein